MTRISSRIVGSIAACGVALALALPAAAEMDDDQVSLDVVSKDQQQFVSRSGSEILEKIASARQLLSENKRLDARTAVAEARTELAEVRDVSPSIRIKDRIEAAIKNLRSGKKAPEELLPVYGELDAVKSVDDYSDTIALVDRAKGQLGAGDVDAATSSLVEASSRLSFLEIDLPIQETYSNLTSALLKLSQKRDPMAADTYLRNAEAGVKEFVAVVAKSETVDMPAVGAGPAD